MQRVLTIGTWNLSPDILLCFFLGRMFCPHFHEIHENLVLGLHNLPLEYWQPKEISLWGFA